MNYEFHRNIATSQQSYVATIARRNHRTLHAGGQASLEASPGHGRLHHTEHVGKVWCARLVPRRHVILSERVRE
jgi:hypothetical protein